MITYHDALAQFIKITNETDEKILYLIIDLCDCDYPLLAAIENWQPALQYCLLFEQTPEESIKEEGPLLLALDIDNENHLEILEKICEIIHMNNRLLAFNSRYPFGTLEEHLRRAMQVKWGKKEGLLRFYVPDMFDPVNMVLSDAQKNWLHQYMQRWCYVDNNGEWVIYHADYPPCEQNEFDVKGFVFTEKQYNTLLLWADVYNYRRNYGIALDADEYGGERMLINQLYVLATEADAKLILSQKQRVQFFSNNLQKII
ncbi:DUF4123 domain-containing protein [Snodgrassella gandavensis]|uniref:DUF4123 domain-containing protein n=1 Tax=Snodgrassella gandavensis TaxID=2946698 RepID=UPI001EF3D8CC|nr:DUF4123 domain-containing protein [Snodgrassella gandavensis]